MNGEIVAEWDENGEDVRFCSLNEFVTLLSFPNPSAIGSDKLIDLAVEQFIMNNLPEENGLTR